MRTAGCVSAALVVVAVSVGHAAAQALPSSDTLRRAFERELGRTARAVDQTIESSTGRWNDVRRIEPGEPIELILDDAIPVRRHFVAANDEEMVVLNVSGLPTPAADAVRGLASTQPEWLARLSPVGTIDIDANVRVAGGAVWVEGRPVAAVEHVVLRHARASVRQVGLLQPSPRRTVPLGTPGVGGFFTSSFLAANSAESAAPCRCDRPRQREAVGTLVGALIETARVGRVAARQAKRAAPVVRVVYRVR